MSAAPDSTDLAPSRDPAAYGRRPLFGRGFVVAAALCVICVLGGVIFGHFGLQEAAPPAADASAAPAAPAPSRIITPVPIPPPIPAVTPLVVPNPIGSADQALSDRITRLETAGARIDNVAARALAAASLSAAAETAAPFDQDLAAYDRLAPGDPDLAALRPLAPGGALSRAALAASFPDLAAQAAMSARQPDDDAGLMDKLWAALSRVVIVRHVDPAAPGVDGLLARAEDEAAAGDIATAAASVRALPPRARAPFAEWLTAADRRIAIDRDIADLRARALADLTAQQAPPPPASLAGAALSSPTLASPALSSPALSSPILASHVP
ncbi:MAG TPA: hypothetical protein VHW60_10375 [Caulobacteraceae bacterium]|jgi:hypothetical protein|nr:hypothetical protein [Caulobacteraceae bacterium]